MSEQLHAEAQPITRDAVKMLAIAVGLTEAARRLGLNEARVRQWSCRGKWFAKPEPQQLPPTMTKHAVTSVTTPVDALVDSLADDAKETKLALSKATRKAAKTFAGMQGSKVIDKSKALSHVTAAAARIHAWDERGDTGLHLHVLSMGPTQVNVGREG